MKDNECRCGWHAADGRKIFTMKKKKKKDKKEKKEEKNIFHSLANISYTPSV